MTLDSVPETLRGPALAALAALSPPPRTPQEQEAALERVLRQLTPSYGAVVLRGDTLLLILHHRGWGLPKGHQQPGETPEACAAREVWEETGIRVRIDSRFRGVTRSQRKGDRRSVVFFLGEYLEGVLRPQPGETRAVGWFPLPEAVEQVYYPEDRELVRAALRTRQTLAAQPQ